MLGHGMFRNNLYEWHVSGPLHRYSRQQSLHYVACLAGRSAESENDRLRGAGVYSKVTANVQKLLSLGRPPYTGIQFTIRPENVHLMFDFCVEMARLGVDWVLLNPCWFVSPHQAGLYEEFMQTHFGIKPRSHRAYLMPYEIDKSVYKDQMRAIRSRSWPMQISSYLERPEDIDVYVDKPEEPPGNSSVWQWTRWI